MPEKKAVLWDYRRVIFTMDETIQYNAVARAVRATPEAIRNFLSNEPSPQPPLKVREYLETRGSACEIYNLVMDRFDPERVTHYADFVRAWNAGLDLSPHSEPLGMIASELHAAGIKQGIFTSTNAINACYAELMLYQAHAAWERIIPRSQRIYSHEIKVRKEGGLQAYKVACKQLNVRPKNTVAVHYWPEHIYPVTSILYINPQSTRRKLVELGFLPR